MCFDPIDFNDVIKTCRSLKNLQGAAMDIPAAGGEDSANMAEIEIPLVGLNVQALAVPETWS